MPRNRPTRAAQNRSAAAEIAEANLAKQRDELKASIDSSSDKNRNLLIAFLAALLYLLVTIGKTTDKDLLMPESLLSLPIVNIQVGLLPFYFLAPLLLIIFHLNLLFNLLEHRKRIYQLETLLNNRPVDTRTYYSFHAFLFNKSAQQSQAGSFDNLVARFLTTFSVVLAPQYLLILFEWRFSDYQSLSITTWHFVFVCVDYFLLIMYWERMENSKWLGDQHDRLSLVWDAVKTGDLVGIQDYRLWTALILTLTGCVTALHCGVIVDNEVPSYALTIQWGVLILTFTTTTALTILPRNKRGKRLAIAMFMAGLLLNVFVFFYFTLAIHPGTAIPDLLILIGIIYISTIFWDFYWCQKAYATSSNPANQAPDCFVALLGLSGLTVALGIVAILYKTITASKLSGSIVFYRSDETKSLIDAEHIQSYYQFMSCALTFSTAMDNIKTPCKFSPNYDVLTTSQLTLIQVLFKDRLPPANNCQSADWLLPRLVVTNERIFTSLTPAESSAIESLKKISTDTNPAQDATSGNNSANDDSTAKTLELPNNFLPSDLSRRNFRLADFRGSLMPGVNLEQADATGSLFNGTNMKKGRLKKIKLYSSDLESAHLQGVDMSSAALPDASLRFAQLNDTNFFEAQLNGADLNFAILHRAELNDAQMQGVKLRYAQLQGANLRSTKLQGADLFSADLTDANLEGATLGGATNLKDAKLDGAKNLEKAIMSDTTFLSLMLPDFGF